MHFVRIPFLCLLMTCAPSAFAQTDAKLDLSGSVRLRYEAITGQSRAGFNSSDDLANLRTTLLARYQSGAITIAGELWDSRVSGANAGTPITTGEVNTFEFVQAYVAAKGTMGNAKVSGQVGRFTLNLGSRRLIAADDYRNTTNGFTGLKLDVVTPGGMTGTAIYVLPQQRRPDDLNSLLANETTVDHEGSDLVLWGGTVAKAKALGPVAAEASFYHLTERDQLGRPTRDRSLDTYGGRFFKDPAVSQADFEMEGLYQTGTVSSSSASNASRLPVKAWFVHASVGYSIPGSLKTRLSVQYDYASGDDGHRGYGRFDTLYGMRRADLAPAGLYNAVGRANISTIGARLDVAPSKRWDAFVTYHALWLASRTDSFSTTGVRDASGRSGNFAGHQVDGRVRWWIRQDRLRLEVDAVVLKKGRFLKVAPNAPTGDATVYGSVNMTTSF